MEGYKLNDLKLKDFDSIQEMFDRAFKRQKVEDDKETTEIKKLMEIIPDEEEVAIDAIPLAVKSPRTVRFENDHVAAIQGYWDLEWGNILITRVSYVKGLDHNLLKTCSHSRHSIDADLVVDTACNVTKHEFIFLLATLKRAKKVIKDRGKKEKIKEITNTKISNKREFCGGVIEKKNYEEINSKF
ncbi:hypothetical protein Tco_1425463 [Tanacetum coccineum]